MANDMTAITGHVRFSPSILKRLGEELNPNVDQGILELVKNAYDADATECHVYLDGNISGEPAVVVQDDGVGMRADDILSSWLVLGTSSKDTTKATPLGRTPAGNKGLGRLAALRLGRKARMISTTADGATSDVLLDWDTFDHASTVDEVAVAIARSSSATGKRGTTIQLTELRSSVGRVDVRRLARALVLLADPFSDDTQSSFSPHLHSSHYRDLANQVQHRYFDQADYHLVARLRSGRVSAEVLDWRGETLWQGDHSEIAGRTRGRDATYSSPDADFDFWIFILSPENFSTRPVQLAAVREWLGSFGGVHVYVNGLRVAPYGNPGNDWLDLNLARARSPEDRPSTNTAIGRLKVRDRENALPQKTDRSGFIETEAFDEMRTFAVDTLDWTALKRRRESERKRQNTRTQTKRQSSQTSERVRDRIRTLPDKTARFEIEQAFNQYDNAREKEQDSLRTEVQLYRTLSTAGITAATFAHESTGNSLKRLSLLGNTLKAMLKKDLPDQFDSRYKTPMDRLAEAVAALGVLSSATMTLIGHDKRRLGKVRLDVAVSTAVEVYNPFLNGRNVSMTLDLSGGGEPYLRGTEAAIESIVSNLVNNSLAAFERVNVTQRQMRLQTSVESGWWRLDVADNGPGIDDITVDDIWLPGQTQRPGGTGLGLTIVRDTVADLGGTATVIPRGVLGGATFSIRLPILGVDDV